jgi:phage/plasmid-associated DNA primase
MANGCGRNGKGLLNELMLIMLGGDYSYTGNINCLTKPIGSGANPELANLNKKRFVKFEEPNDNDCLQLGNIKKLTGEGYLNARMNYSNDTKTKLDITLIFECNKKPNVNGKIDEAIIDRFVDVLFQSYFTNDEEQLQSNPNAKPKNEAFKQLDFQNIHRCALFDYLVQHGEKDLYVAKCVKDRTRDYLLDNDELFSWFIENYEKETDEILKVKDILQEYKSSELYSNMSKAQKRLCNDKNFRQMIETNIELRKYFVDRKKIDGNTHRSILIGWTKKKNECLV